MPPLSLFVLPGAWKRTKRFLEYIQCIVAAYLLPGLLYILDHVLLAAPPCPEVISNVAEASRITYSQSANPAATVSLGH